MSNIHGLGDYRGGNGGGGGGGGGGGPGYGRMPGGPGGEPLDDETRAAVGLFGGLSGGGGQQTKDPRQENFWEMWKFTFCPSFHTNSFINYLILINTAVFIMELVLTGVNNAYSLNDQVFLGPDQRVLNDMGAKNPYLVTNDFL